MAVTISGSTPTFSAATGYAGGTITSGTVNGGAANPLASGTTVDFTSIPSWVKKITIMFSGVSTSGISAIITQLGTSSGILSSGYADSLGTIATATASVLSAGSGFATANLSANTDVASGSITLCLLNSNTWVVSGVTRLTSVRACYLAGSVSLGGTLDRVRITTFTGTDTFDAGSINILYE